MVNGERLLENVLDTIRIYAFLSNRRSSSIMEI